MPAADPAYERHLGDRHLPIHQPLSAGGTVAFPLRIAYRQVNVGMLLREPRPRGRHKAQGGCADDMGTALNIIRCWAANCYAASPHASAAYLPLLQRKS